MIQAILFDMDGVIIDSELHWRDAEREYLSPRVARPLEQAELMGLSMDGFHRALTGGYGLKMDYPEFQELYRTMARDIYARRCGLTPGFLELVDRLRWERVLVGLASSSPTEWVDLVLARFGLRFEAVADADDVGGEGKPSPAVYLAAARMLRVKPEACVAIEDSANGVKAAKAAGMACVALRNGFNGEQDLSLADLEVDSLVGLTPRKLLGLSPLGPL